jgi:hypothetical protein
VLDAKSNRLGGRADFIFGRSGYIGNTAARGSAVEQMNTLSSDKKKKVASVSENIKRAVQRQGYYMRKLTDFKKR